MIYDRLTRLLRFRTSQLSSGIDCLVEHSQTNRPPGRYDVTNGIVLNVQKLKSLDYTSCRWETHRRYIDIQYIQCGVEGMEVSSVENLHEPMEYDSEKDKTLYNRGLGSVLTVSTGDFVVFFPDDGHKCCIPITDDKPVRKLCLKIPV